MLSNVMMETFSLCAKSCVDTEELEIWLVCLRN